MYTGAMQMISKPIFSEQCESYTAKHFNLWHRNSDLQMFLSSRQTSCIVQSGLHSDPSDISAIWRSSQYLHISNISEKWRCCQYVLANINKRKTNPIENKTRTNPKPKCADKSEQQ